MTLTHLRRTRSLGFLTAATAVALTTTAAPAQASTNASCSIAAVWGNVFSMNPQVCPGYLDTGSPYVFDVQNALSVQILPAWPIPLGHRIVTCQVFTGASVASGTIYYNYSGCAHQPA